ncbi:paraquat-inducible protein A [Colwellia sp. E2M01]|uniref:paraquat-inducible protein A n=1 Tax=Colwellia sp. E2M01 TaxID=2841561 RepID=UPI001C0964AB|nr:paraquat-inducible protein A [Colwellia sp. E2M01]MBU2870254.1 paraquat-inducible protein A [Colwellia sp. E2M01]
MTKHLGFFLNLVAIGLFIPGITLPIFSLVMEANAHVGGSQLTTELVNKELSLLGTINELWLDDRLLVAIALFIFSIAIPVIKATLVCTAYFISNTSLAKKILNVISAIGKWSMADVFVIAVFLAVLSTNHAETINHQQFTLFSFQIKLALSSETISNVGKGFYYFFGYCVLSLLASQISQYAINKTK